jgi:hypothetical protein
MNLPGLVADRPVLTRVVEAETLDHLEPDDPHAERARRDLLRVNRVMGTTRILAGAMRSAMDGRMPAGRPLRVLEIGCGDGDLLLASRWSTSRRAAPSVRAAGSPAPSPPTSSSGPARRRTGRASTWSSPTSSCITSRRSRSPPC